MIGKFQMRIHRNGHKREADFTGDRDQMKCSLYFFPDDALRSTLCQSIKPFNECKKKLDLSLNSLESIFSQLGCQWFLDLNILALVGKNGKVISVRCRSIILRQIVLLKIIFAFSSDRHNNCFFWKGNTLQEAFHSSYCTFSIGEYCALKAHW